MKTCNLVIGQMWGGANINQTVDIPDDVYFYDADTLGDGIITGCKYYCTVLKTSNYAEWLEYLKKRELWSWDIDEVGEYTIITIRIVYEDKHNLPIKDSAEILKDVNFNKYVFVYYDHNRRCINVRRIFNFKHIYGVTVGYITFRDFMGFNEMQSIRTEIVKLNTMFPSQWDSVYGKYEILEGDKAEQIWNTAINKVVSTNFNYDPHKVNEDYNFNAEYDKWMETHPKSLTEMLEEFKLECFANVEQIEKSRQKV